MITTDQRYAGVDAAVKARLLASVEDLEAQRLDAAAARLDALPPAVAQHPEVLRLRGLLAYQRDRSADALAPLVAALKQRPDDDLIAAGLGACYERLGDDVDALKAYELACNAAPSRVGHWLNFARVLNRAGWLQHAKAVLDHVVKMAPRDTAARVMLASTLAANGRNAEAQRAFRQLVTEDSGNGRAWLSLAMQRPMPLTVADIAVMQSALAGNRVGVTEREPLLFALGMAQEHARDIDGAWHSFSVAHDLARQGRAPWDAAAFTADVTRELAAFGDLPAPRPEDAGREVIFIVSLPRSGSTLVEQVLASHSTVAGAGELYAVGELIAELSNAHATEYPQWVADATDDEWRAAGQRYLQRTAHWRKSRPRMTDKLPGNWAYIGAILRMLPNARVVAVRRDPVETCLACWHTMLAGHAYTHRFEDLAVFQRGFERSVSTWQTRCPDRVRVVDYEALTAAPETQIRALLDFCGLPFEPACLESHATARRVATLSAAQVREPIHRATPRAALYGARLDPLRRALGLPVES